MLKHFGKVVVVLFLGFLLFGMPVTSSAIVIAPSLEFSPMDQTVNLGDSASVGVWVTNPGDTMIQYVDIWVMYNASIITFDSLAFGNPVALDYADTTGAPDESLDGPPMWVMHLDAETYVNGNLNQNGNSFLLATLNFNAIGIGTSALSFIDANEDPANGVSSDGPLVRDLFLANENWISLGEVKPGSITVAGATNVPEPGTALLLGFGLAALAALKKKTS